MARPFSIGVTGSGGLLNPFIGHALKRFPTATVYDRTDVVNAARRKEVELARRGLMNKKSTADAMRIEKALSKPVADDVTVSCSGIVDSMKITVTCAKGKARTFSVPQALLFLDDDDALAFILVDQAIEACTRSRHLA